MDLSVALFVIAAAAAAAVCVVGPQWARRYAIVSASALAIIVVGVWAIAALST